MLIFLAVPTTRSIICCRSSFSKRWVGADMLSAAIVFPMREMIGAPMPNVSRMTSPLLSAYPCLRICASSASNLCRFVIVVSEKRGSPMSSMIFSCFCRLTKAMRIFPEAPACSGKIAPSACEIRSVWCPSTLSTHTPCWACRVERTIVSPVAMESCRMNGRANSCRRFLGTLRARSRIIAPSWYTPATLASSMSPTCFKADAYR